MGSTGGQRSAEEQRDLAGLHASAGAIWLATVRELPSTPAPVHATISASAKNHGCGGEAPSARSGATAAGSTISIPNTTGIDRVAGHPCSAVISARSVA